VEGAGVVAFDALGVTLSVSCEGFDASPPAGLIEISGWLSLLLLAEALSVTLDEGGDSACKDVAETSAEAGREPSPGIERTRGDRGDFSARSTFSTRLSHSESLESLWSEWRSGLSASENELLKKRNNKRQNSTRERIQY
jgi:hypothetical protein